MIFIHSFSSEWLKTRRTAAAWLVILGALFIPVILLIARVVQSEALYEENTSALFWNGLIHRCWQFMAIFLLPMGVILATSLITQNEFRNNTWKQLHATPQSLHVIFFAKLSVIVVMLLQFFVLFNAGIYLAGIVPGLFFADVPWPVQPFPLSDVITTTASYFLSCLPVVALQFLISMQFRNFLIPLGTGIALLISALIALSWRYSYLHPYSYSGLQFIGTEQDEAPHTNIAAWSLGYFLIITAAAYVLYLTKREKA
jgi:hypothetical protein